MPGDRILVVEDEVALEAEPLKRKLKQWGYDVIGIAATEADAVNIALRERPSVVLMDIRLGDDPLAGLRAAHRIRRATSAQIIFVTGTLGNSEVLGEARRMPDFEFLIKPVPDDQLRASTVVAVARARQTIFVAYSHKDIRFADEMMVSLKPLKVLGTSAWIDTGIAPAENWKQEIDRALGEAKAAVCLVSPEFAASRFITEVELPNLFQAKRDRGLCVYPVFVNYVAEPVLESLGLLQFQGINRPDDPIAAWQKHRRQKDCWGVSCKSLFTPANPFAAHP
jgi:CheY-like chemotaxis protein